MWTRGLARWYVNRGRHDLPWRQTRDPWLILVSEVMLQQTQVSRVRPRWEEFASRWPSPQSFAAAPPKEVLRAWQGLGYPRRAVALQRTAALLVAGGWPADETGLRSLPGVGHYTARALLVLALDTDSPVPIDVNVARVTARAALGVEPAHATAAALDQATERGRPARMSRRDYTYALFDTGALHCRATPSCSGCPLASGCASRARAGAPLPSARRQAPYRGSVRELRGALLRALLDGVAPEDADTLRERTRTCAAAARPGAIAAALRGLQRDGLAGGEALPGFDDGRRT